MEGYPETYIDLRGEIPERFMSTADLGSIWAMRSSLSAIKMAGWEDQEVRDPSTGVVIGSGAGGHLILRPAWDGFFNKGYKTRVLGSHNVDRAMVYRDAANVSCLVGSQGVCEAIGSACACGLGNIGYAYRLIAFGLQDRILAGGTEGTSIETFIGFDAMQVLSRRFSPGESSRPFDKHRDGFVCSFGCGVVALEAYDMALARGANILAVVDGYFNNSDGDGDMFAPSFDGQSRLWAGLRTASEAEIRPDVVKVHGTSTPSGDTMELLSVVQAMGNEGYHISAPKSQFGHFLGAAGAIEVIVSILMLQEQKVSPCLNSNDLKEDPEDFQLTDGWLGSKEGIASYRHLLPTQSISKPISQIVNLNYGFGGTNSAIAMSLPNGPNSTI